MESTKKSGVFIDSLGREWDAYHPYPKDLTPKHPVRNFIKSLFTLDPRETWMGVVLFILGFFLLFPLFFIFIGLFSTESRQRYHREHGFRNPRTW